MQFDERVARGMVSMLRLSPNGRQVTHVRVISMVRSIKRCDAAEWCSERAGETRDPAHQGLPQGRLSPLAAEVQVHSHLLGVCDHCNRAVRRDSRWLACGEAHRALSPMEPRRR